MIDLDIPLFSTSQVAAAINVSPRTFQGWLERRVLQMDEEWGESESEGSGDHRRFTLRRALTAGATAGLVELGIPPKVAAEAAEVWTHQGRGPLPGLGKEHRPAALFPADSFTFLRCFKNGDVDIYEVTNKTSVLDMLSNPKNAGLDASVVLLCVNIVDAQVRKALVEGRA